MDLKELKKKLDDLGMNEPIALAVSLKIVFVTAADDIWGVNAKQLAERLTIPESPTGFRVIEFPTQKSGIASPVNRTDPGFIAGGRTAGGARKFVIPNAAVSAGASARVVP